MRYLNLLIIFLILLLPFTVEAGTGSVKVIDKDGNDVTKYNMKPSDKSQSKDENKEEEVKDPSSTPSITNMEAGTAMIENAGINIGYRLADEFLEGGYKLASVGIEEKKVTGSKTLQYKLYSNELDPLGDSSVKSILSKSKMVYYAGAIIFICFAYMAFVSQHTFPTWFSDARESISGEESYFDFKALALTWLLVILGPSIQKLIIQMILATRNTLVTGMTTRMVESVGAASDSLPTYFLVNFGWYVNGIQKLICEYGAYLLISLTYVTCAIIAALTIFFTFKHAVKFACVVNLYLVLFTLMDIVTLFFVSFGINLSITRSSDGYILAGIFFAVISAFLIIIIPTVWLFFQSKFARRHVRIGVI